jgi:periplasmic protein CpxP/Spy
MKTLKISMLALLMVIGNIVFAQQGGGNKTAEERATAHSQKLTQQLGLSADQQKSVYAACLTRAQQMDADRAQNQGNREAMKAGRQQINQTFETSMGQVLTPEQKTKWEQIKQEEKANRQQGGAGQRGGE